MPYFIIWIILIKPVLFWNSTWFKNNQPSMTTASPLLESSGPTSSANPGSCLMWQWRYPDLTPGSAMYHLRFCFSFLICKTGLSWGLYATYYMLNQWQLLLLPLFTRQQSESQDQFSSVKWWPIIWLFESFHF